MSINARQHSTYPRRQINPKPGVVFTLILCSPYLSNSLKSFQRSTGHDIVLVGLLTLLWGTIFFWDVIGRKWPSIRLAIEALLVLVFFSGIAALYATIYFLILKR